MSSLIYLESAGREKPLIFAANLADHSGYNEMTAYCIFPTTQAYQQELRDWLRHRLNIWYWVSFFRHCSDLVSGLWMRSSFARVKQEFFRCTWSVSVGWRSNQGDCQRGSGGFRPRTVSECPACQSVSRLKNPFCHTADIRPTWLTACHSRWFAWHHRASVTPRSGCAGLRMFLQMSHQAARYETPWKSPLSTMFSKQGWEMKGVFVLSHHRYRHLSLRQLIDGPEKQDKAYSRRLG